MECIVMEQRDFMGARTVDLIPLATPLAPIVGDHKACERSFQVKGLGWHERKFA
jgi:hypothetical protein